VLKREAEANFFLGGGGGATLGKPASPSGGSPRTVFVGVDEYDAPTTTLPATKGTREALRKSP
jgi:hypothetical protein